MQRISISKKTRFGILFILLLGLGLGIGATSINYRNKFTLLYLSQPGSTAETLVQYHLNGSKETLLANFGALQEYLPSPDGRWLAMITQADGVEQVQLYAIKQNRFEHTYDCKSVCNALSWEAGSTTVYFHEADSSGEGTNRILSMNTQIGEVTPLTFKAGLQPTYFSQSPNGRYQVVYDASAKGYYILDNWQKELKLELSQDAAAVVWQENPARVTLVVSRNEAKIPITEIKVLYLETLWVRYAHDDEIAYMDYTNLIQHPLTHELVMGCRPVLRTTSRQLCRIEPENLAVQLLTNLQDQNHAAAVFSGKGNWLAYQTYEMDSSVARPAVWLMDWATQTSVLVADDASMPQWIP
jgi:hypothetical protein